MERLLPEEVDPNNWWDDIDLGDGDAGFVFGVEPDDRETICHFDGRRLKPGDGRFSHILQSYDEEEKENSSFERYCYKTYCLEHFMADLGL